MSEAFRSCEGGIRTTALFIHDLLRHSTERPSSVSFWDETTESQFGELVFKKLSNPHDKERIKIRDVLKKFKVKSVLDMGSGPSTEYACFTEDEDLSGVSYVGLDGSQKMLQIAKSRYPEIVLVRGSIEETPFKDKSFDGVVIKHVLEHQPNGYETTITEALRLAKKCIVIDFFHIPVRFGIPDIMISDYKGYANNWYSKKRFENFLTSLPISSWDRISCEGRRGQFGAIYTLAI